jgi:hypothetical protein
VHLLAYHFHYLFKNRKRINHFASRRIYHRVCAIQCDGVGILVGNHAQLIEIDRLAPSTHWIDRWVGDTTRYLGFLFENQTHLTDHHCGREHSCWATQLPLELLEDTQCKSSCDPI